MNKDTKDILEMIGGIAVFIVIGFIIGHIVDLIEIIKEYVSGISGLKIRTVDNLFSIAWLIICWAAFIGFFYFTDRK